MIFNLKSCKSLLKNLRNNHEIKKIRKLQRYKHYTTNILGYPTKFVDSESFLFTHKEIFENYIYDFKSNSDVPRIIDGGANIGLATIFFKRKFPQSKVVAFEPDDKIFKVLKDNIKTHNLDNVSTINAALWKNENGIVMGIEGADSGRIDEIPKNFETKKVKTTILSKYIKTHVAFLKLDIEGSEVEVLEESSNYLKNIENIFIEYHSFENRNKGLAKIIKILEDNSFKYYISAPGFTNTMPLVNTKIYHGMDWQINIYGKNLLTI